MNFTTIKHNTSTNVHSNAQGKNAASEHGSEAAGNICVYIADTSSVMQYPEIISLFSGSQDLLIVPIAVLQELDAQKASVAAQKAMREICKSQNSASINTSEESHPELLSQDLSNKSDFNKIISVALNRKKENPTIISDDLDLCHIADSLGIKTISGSDLMNRYQKSTIKGASALIPDITEQFAAISNKLKIIYDIVEEASLSTGFSHGHITKKQFIDILRERRNKQNANLLYIARELDAPFCITGKYVNAHYMPSRQHTVFCIRMVRPLFAGNRHIKGYSLCPKVAVAAPGHFNIQNLKIVSRQRQIQICFFVKACISSIGEQEVGAVKLAAKKNSVLFSTSQTEAWVQSLSKRHDLLDFQELSNGLFLRT